MAGALAIVGCNAVLGVEPLKDEPDAARLQQREFSQLAADSGEEPSAPAKADSDPDSGPNDHDAARDADNSVRTPAQPEL